MKANVETNREGRSCELARLVLGKEQNVLTKVVWGTDSFGAREQYDGCSLQESSETRDWVKADTLGKPPTPFTWRPAHHHAPETKETSPEPISDQLPKNISVSPIFPNFSPDPRRLRPWKEKWRVDTEPNCAPHPLRCWTRRSERPKAKCLASDEVEENMTFDMRLELSSGMACKTMGTAQGVIKVSQQREIKYIYLKKVIKN